MRTYSQQLRSQKNRCFQHTSLNTHSITGVLASVGCALRRTKCGATLSRAFRDCYEEELANGDVSQVNHFETLSYLFGDLLIVTIFPYVNTSLFQAFFLTRVSAHHLAPNVDVMRSLPDACILLLDYSFLYNFLLDFVLEVSLSHRHYQQVSHAQHLQADRQADVGAREPSAAVRYDLPLNYSFL